MRFLVPRSRPLEWVIVKVKASYQDGPDWVRVQQLHTTVPRLSTLATADILFVLKPLNVYSSQSFFFYPHLQHSGACALKHLTNFGHNSLVFMTVHLPVLVHQRLPTGNICLINCCINEVDAMIAVNHPESVCPKGEIFNTVPLLTANRVN